MLAYGTPERMKAAKPVAAQISQSMTYAPSPVTIFSITNGKLFNGGYESGSWCSASAISASSKRVLITAGHRVHGGQAGTWLQNLVFVSACNAFNTTVVNTIGGHGLVYNGGTEFETSIIGYPGNHDGGNVMWACWGTATDNADWWVELMRMRPPLPLAAGLLAVVAVSACGSVAEPDSDTSGIRAPTGPTGPEVLPTRSDLIDAQVVQWRDWRSVDDRTVWRSAGRPGEVAPVGRDVAQSDGVRAHHPPRGGRSRHPSRR